MVVGVRPHVHLYIHVFEQVSREMACRLLLEKTHPSESLLGNPFRNRQPARKCLGGSRGKWDE